VFADSIFYVIEAQEDDATPTTKHGSIATRRHGSVTNVGFADGHVDNIRLGDLWTLPWKHDWKRTEPYPVPDDWNGVVATK
jgi:prepilin-type processing-associated H-X9-DG protein